MKFYLYFCRYRRLVTNLKKNGFLPQMKAEYLQKILDYSLILLYDCSSLSKDAITNDMLIEIFIRNSLKVASIRRLVQYFEEHLGRKSAINEGPGRRVLDWIKFHNALKRRPGYEKIVPFTVRDRSVALAFPLGFHLIRLYIFRIKVPNPNTFFLFRW